MNPHSATATHVLNDLLIERHRNGATPREYLALTVAVALWEPPICRFERKAAGHVADPSTATVRMSAALYVRLYPHGHYGPTVGAGS